MCGWFFDMLMAANPCSQCKGKALDPGRKWFVRFSTEPWVACVSFMPVIFFRETDSQLVLLCQEKPNFQINFELSGMKLAT